MRRILDRALLKSIGLLERGSTRLTPFSLNHAERRIYSQNGEDGIIAEIFARIGTTNRFFVEIGNGVGCECNTRLLIEKEGWSGLLVETAKGDMKSTHQRFSGFPVQLITERVLPSNVDRILVERSVPASFDLLSIDVDGNDYWIWDGLGAFRPRVVCIEYNASYLPATSWVMPFDAEHEWDGSWYFGASLKEMTRMARVKGYALVGCDSRGVNAFFVDRPLLRHRFVRPDSVWFHYRCPKYCRDSFGHPRKRQSQTNLDSYRRLTGSPPLVRPSSYDKSIWNAVAQEYPLPAAFDAADTVIDIGCHIGGFSALVVARGAGRVLSFEASRENARISRRNLAPFPNVDVYNLAVWRSDLDHQPDLLFMPHSDDINTGGGSVVFRQPRSCHRSAQGDSFHDHTHIIATIALDQILARAGRVRILKIDAEGAEYPILMTSEKLGQVDEIVGEYHQFRPDQVGRCSTSALGPFTYRFEDLASFLRRQGFSVSSRPVTRDIGLFRARRHDAHGEK